MSEEIKLAAGSITVTQRTGDWHAQITGEPRLWDCGKTKQEAIGNLIITHGAERFAIMP